MIRLDEAKRVHMVGIGGIGMSALAQYLADQGVRVSGSDRSHSPVTELLAEKGIDTTYEQEKGIVPEDTDLLIYTEAVWEDNLERVRATELGIPQRSYFDALGDISKAKRTIAIAGTHGKTTTTGMLARVLKDAGLSPTAIVGSLVRDFGSNYLAGNSDWFVVEACEYKRDFLTLSPEILVITNIEFDHSDYYKDLADVQSAFRSMALKVPAGGCIITNPSDPNIAPVLEGLSVLVIDYTKETRYPTRFPGEFNVMNARAASAVARYVMPNLSEEALRDSLAEFKGTWRRFEYKGKTARGADVYDDYAHHPTAVEKTMTALREKVGSTKIFVAFHPHLFSRTRDLLPGFATAFKEADTLLIAPIYGAREVDDGSMSSEILADSIRKNGVDASAASFKEIQAFLETEPSAGDVVMIMGAGDIYTIADQLVESS